MDRIQIACTTARHFSGRGLYPKSTLWSSFVILDSGQYHDQWKDIHMVPEETVQAAVDLNAKKLFAVHWSKFTMAHHPWYEPIERMIQVADAIGLPYFTAKIGEVVEWDKKVKGEPWWKMR